MGAASVRDLALRGLQEVGRAPLSRDPHIPTISRFVAAEKRQEFLLAVALKPDGDG